MDLICYIEKLNELIEKNPEYMGLKVIVKEKGKYKNAGFPKIGRISTKGLEVKKPGSEGVNTICIN